MTGFFIVVVAIGWVFAQVWADSSILYIAIIFSILMNFFSYWYSDKIVVKMSGAKPANREEFLIYGRAWKIFQLLPVSRCLKFM